MDLIKSVGEPMNPRHLRVIPLAGVLTAVVMLLVATVSYRGDAPMSRVTVSMLCARNLPDGAPNTGRAVPIIGLLILCASMALLFQSISGAAEGRWHRDLIQIGGIGSQVYSLLTVTPLHNLMFNIASAFFLVAIVAIVSMLHRKRAYGLAVTGGVFLGVMLVHGFLYYTGRAADVWGILQKSAFLLTTGWLLVVQMTVRRSP